MTFFEKLNENILQFFWGENIQQNGSSSQSGDTPQSAEEKEEDEILREYSREFLLDMMYRCTAESAIGTSNINPDLKESDKVILANSAPWPLATAK